jgi:branched-subunit amino acid transport protein
MRTTAILMFVSLASLVALILPSILFLAGRMELGTAKWVMLLATVVWFVAATPWLWKQSG